MISDDQEPTGRSSDVCGGDSGELLGRIRLALQQFALQPDEIEVQRIVCLATRSSYTEFYTQSVITGQTDRSLGRQLQMLISEAAERLPRGRYQDSVVNRLDELRRYLAAVPSPTDTAV
ncbi:MAG: hypothetical protein KDA85_09185 [Planctomycetaceae bacterium]|nr:hypothetical protein [Planctomycetaceae bacterium]